MRQKQFYYVSLPTRFKNCAPQRRVTVDILNIHFSTSIKQLLSHINSIFLSSKMQGCPA